MSAYPWKCSDFPDLWHPTPSRLVPSEDLNLHTFSSNMAAWSTTQYYHETYVTYLDNIWQYIWIHYLFFNLAFCRLCAKRKTLSATSFQFIHHFYCNRMGLSSRQTDQPIPLTVTSPEKTSASSTLTFGFTQDMNTCPLSESPVFVWPIHPPTSFIVFFFFFFSLGWRSHNPPYSDSDWPALAAFIGLVHLDWIDLGMRSVIR